MAYDVNLPVKIFNGVLNIEFRTLIDNAMVNAIEVKADEFIFGVNSGGAQYTNGNGNVYVTDQYFRGGQTGTISNPIDGTVDDVLYHSIRYGNFSYEIPLSNGNYTVVLKFAEIYWNQAGQRVFDVLINGNRVVAGLDVFRQNMSIPENLHIIPFGKPVKFGWDPVEKPEGFSSIWYEMVLKTASGVQLHQQMHTGTISAPVLIEWEDDILLHVRSWGKKTDGTDVPSETWSSSMVVGIPAPWMISGRLSDPKNFEMY